MSIFCDQTLVEFIGGKGGDGCVHFHREKFIARGGPDGGDGGQGGSIILIADENINTLVEFNNRKIFVGGEAENGQKKKMYGKDGEDLTLKVPAGTLLIDDKTNELICDLKRHNQTFVIARGGKGGLGNHNFASSVHQAPQFAEMGEIGERRKVRMELQLVADVGIIGFPSAGKSTLISRISNAKPKIAAYHFTTLIPNLGVVAMSKFDKRMKESFVVADIPGLIEGAHKGKGLGHEFLRHVSRTEVLVHLIDPTRDDVTDFSIINKELELYDKRLSAKEQIVVISKSDAVLAEDLEKFKKALLKKEPQLKKKLFIISSSTGDGLKELAFEMFKEVSAFRENRAKVRAADELVINAQEKVFKPHLAKNRWKVTFRRTKEEASSKKVRRIFDVNGERIEQVMNMTDIENPEGMERIYHFLKKMGIYSELRKMGAIAGDRIRIAGKTILMR